MMPEPVPASSADGALMVKIDGAALAETAGKNQSVPRLMPEPVPASSADVALMVTIDGAALAATAVMGVAFLALLTVMLVGPEVLGAGLELLASTAATIPAPDAPPTTAATTAAMTTMPAVPGPRFFGGTAT